MRTKAAVNPRPDRLLKAVHSVSALLRKKKPKRLTPKKMVRFSLMTKSSSSEIMLSGSTPVDSVKAGYVQAGAELKTQSCVNIATSSIVSRPNYPRPFPFLFHESESQSQIQVKCYRIKSLQKYIHCFNDLCLFGPIFNLQKRVPVKGILKNVPRSWSTYRSGENVMSDKDPSLTMANIRDTKAHCCSSSSTVCTQPTCLCRSGPNHGSADIKDVIIFDNLTTSIQELHIDSGHSQEDQCHKKVATTTVHPSFQFVSYLP